jgi:UDP-N-acetylglucosamine 4,6-dehydratase
MFNNKTIFISGGTGSFGQQFVRQILAKYKVKKIIIYSRDEYKQFLMRSVFPAEKYSCLRFFLGDVRDKDRLLLGMKEVDYVVHAAALKHVPAAEYNPMEFVKTNIYGAENIVYAAIESKVQRVIALSTDKAVNPINLYGATKLVSDKIFVAANNLVGKQDIKFSVVRYGNVVGSRGSIAPFFQDLINNNCKYLPITDPNMTRFWITLEKGVDFVLKSFKIMNGGEIFIPKIPSIKIVDLAKAMGPNIRTKIIGIRAGEKIHELMCAKEMSKQTLEFRDFYIILPYFYYSNDSLKYIKNYFSILKEKGKKVPLNFEYSSETNRKFLNLSQIMTLNKNI